MHEKGGERIKGQVRRRREREEAQEKWYGIKKYNIEFRVQR